LGSFARGQVKDSDIYFVNNAASSGGAVYMTGNTWLGFSNSTVVYDRNQFSQIGGAIYISGGSTMVYNNMSRVYFSSNIAVSSGGAIYATGTSYIDFDVDFLDFRYNRSVFGNGIVYEDAVSTVDFSKAKYIRAIGNDALVGGFLYVDGRIKEINGILEVIENTARSGSGGGLNIINGSNIRLAGHHSSFISNTALTSGSAIYLDGNSKMTLTSKYITVNYNRTLSGITPRGIFGAGAIYVNNSSINFAGPYNGVNK
jgi:predicted outer membrane repeat protein